jgi:hypothetical protein
MDKSKTTIILIAVGIIILGGAGYFLLKDTFVKSDSSQQEEESSDTEDASLKYDLGDTTVEVESGDEEWPNDIPSTIPEFKYGDIDSTAKVANDYANSWTVICNNIEEDAFEDYKTDLEDAGFSNISTLETSEGSMLTVSKEPYTMIVTYNKDENTLGLSITQSLE